MKGAPLTLEEMREAIARHGLLIEMITREIKDIRKATGTAPHIFHKEEMEPLIDRYFVDEKKADLSEEHKQLLNEMGQAIRDLADLAVDIATVDLADEEEMNRQDCEVERLNRQINELGRRQKKLIRRARLNRISERRTDSREEESQ